MIFDKIVVVVLMAGNRRNRCSVLGNNELQTATCKRRG